MEQKYVFASEEWPNYVENLFADGFAFFVDGENIALTPDGLGVSIGSINCMGRTETCTHCCSNCALYVNNGGGGNSVSCEGKDNFGPKPNQNKLTYNAYTKVMEGFKILEPGTHTMKMVVADMIDGAHDSSVFIAAKSIVAKPQMCYSVTQVCSTVFEEVFVRPLTIYPSGHPILTRTDCGGVPGSDKLPGEGKMLGGDCATKVDGGVLFYSYDPTTRSGRDQLAKDGHALMYVIRDSYERAYLVVSLGKPMLGAGKIKASTIMDFKLVDVTGDPSPIVKDDPNGDVYNWDPANNRGQFTWNWGREETDGVVLGPFVEGAGWCVEWDMSEMSPSESLNKFQFGSFENGQFETKIDISIDMFDLGGGKGVRLCGCASELGQTCQETTCRRKADDCQLTPGGGGSTSTTGTTGSSSGSSSGTGTVSSDGGSGAAAGATGASSGTGSGMGNNQVGGTGGTDGTAATACGSGGSDCGVGGSGTLTAGKVDGTEDTTKYGELGAASMALLVLFGLSCTICFVIAAVVVPHKKRIANSKRKTMASKSKARRSLDVPAGDRDGIEMATVGLGNGFGGGRRENTVARRKMLSEALKGSRWWYIDLDGLEQGPFSSTEMIGWAEWDYLNCQMMMFEVPAGANEFQKKQIEYVPLMKSRLAPFLGFVPCNDDNSSLLIFESAIIGELGGETKVKFNPLTNEKNKEKKKKKKKKKKGSTKKVKIQELSKEKKRATMMKRPVSKPRGTLQLSTRSGM